MPSRVQAPSSDSNNLNQPRERTIKKPKLTNTPISEIFLKACEEMDIEKIKSCLTLDVDINCTDKDGHSGLYKVLGSWMVKRKREVVDLFLQNPDLDIELVNREKILGRVWYADQVRELCNLPGIDVNAGNPLGVAAIVNNKDIIKILAEKPELNWNNNENGGYPIIAALDFGYHEVVELLLEQPTLDLNVIDCRGKSVAHVAVEYLRKKALKRLGWGCDVSSPIKSVELLSKDPRVNWNAKDRNGKTPVMIALRNEETEMLKILIKTPGVDLGDIIKVKEGNDLLKEMLKEADETKQRLLSSVPECPVCLSQFRKDSQVFQCSKGHFVCRECQPRIQHCPVCRNRMIGRSFGFEKFLRNMNL